jgi:hypothetical protein
LLQIIDEITTKRKTMSRAKTKSVQGVEIKRTIESDSPLIMPDIEDKPVDDDPALLSTEEEEADEAPSLDEEELNPFGDKWEQ